LPRFGRSSASELSTCEPKLRKLFEEVVKKYDCTVIEGRRTRQRQEQLVAQGKSRTLDSKHLANASGWSEACDIAPCPIDWEDTIGFYHFAGYVRGIADQLGIKIRWGGDWDSDFDLDDQTFMDLVHFELLE
jgi:peptidoglycan L-alanyl-D-glutamate endopeptidase CwlK